MGTLKMAKYENMQHTLRFFYIHEKLAALNKKPRNLIRGKSR